jgi:hypothetical protein
VGTAAFRCADALKAEIKHPDTWVHVCAEFIYFFMHFVNRSALSNLGHERRIGLQDKLGPLVAKTFVTTLFEHWPEERRRGIEREFFENFNNSEAE